MIAFSAQFINTYHLIRFLIVLKDTLFLFTVYQGSLSVYYKPENIAINCDNCDKLFDFGMAKELRKVQRSQSI